MAETPAAAEVRYPAIRPGPVGTADEIAAARLIAQARAAIEAGEETEDAERYEREVREELAPYMGEERVNRYFDMFPARTDWAGVAFYVKRNP